MRGHLRKRSKNSWSIALYLGKDEGGKPRYQWHTVRGTKQQAEDECTRLLNDLRTGEYVAPTPTTLAEYLERWLEDYARTSVGAKTFERYAEIVRQHLIPALGRHRLTKLQPLSVQAYYSEAMRSGRRDGRGGLSAQTVLHHHRVLKTALQQAVRWRLLRVNPADSVEPPHPTVREMRVLDEPQTATLLRRIEGTTLYVPVLLAVTTGMRRGEFLATRWSDLDAGTLSVQQTLQQTRAAGVTFKQPKTRKGRRVIALPRFVVAALKRHRAEQGVVRLRLGAAYRDHDLVCAKPDGSPRSPAGFTRAFRDLVKKLGLPRVRLHDMRHSHATQLLRQNVHPKVVSERLGHSTIGITLDTYSHVVPGMQEEAAQRIDTALQTALRNEGARRRRSRRR